jgi:V8-like Glu-specific endopeptidase
MPEARPNTDELNRLTEVVAGLYDFTDLGPRGRREIIQRAELGRFLPGIDLTGPPKTVAWDLINRLNNFGDFLPEKPTYDALGALLSYLLTIRELRREDAKFVAELIVKYALVADPTYVEKLRAEYDLTEAEVPRLAKAPARLPAKKTDVSIPRGPSFEVAIKDEVAAEALERVIDDETNFLDIYLLFGAIYSAQAVCLIERPEGTRIGTGFLVGPDVVLTNQHVLRGEQYSEDAVARFGVMLDAKEVEQPGQAFRVCQFLDSSPEKELDYALVRLEDQPLKDMLVDDEGSNLSLEDLVRVGKHRGYLTLAPDKIFEHQRVSIIQHPNGDPMKVVMTHNYVVQDMTETRVQYLADTMDGSSGSPVFNEKWEVVALHHSGAPWPPESGQDKLKKLFRGVTAVNEGIPIRAIIKEIERFLPK